MKRHTGAAWTWAIKKHTMTSVIVFLTFVWIAISWLVYRVELHAPDANIHSFGDGLWWGVATFLTVGYGDKVPVTTEGRLMAGVLMSTGVLAVGILTARISSYFMEQALREGRGVMDTAKLKDHFVVCGWKDDMHVMLTHIMDFNPGLVAKQMVLIANLTQAQVDELRAHSRLAELNIVVGDYFTEFNLKRAAPERARKVMILADRTVGASGQMATATEIDARTMMTAMTLSTIARGTLVAAEVLDPKMESYLRLAQVSEVIFTREYNRLLLVNASGGTGITNIIFDLLDPGTSARIATQAIAPEFIGKTYGELHKAYAETHRADVLVGILENSGSQHNMKELALRNAQKTTDVRQLLDNLKVVKNLKCNQPVFHPEDQYVVHEGSMAIVITNHRRARHDSIGQAAAA